MNCNSMPLVIIAGPTAVGKTQVSVELAKRINGSVISADSMQIYRYMDIGTAKIPKEEMQQIPHYLIDELLPDEEFHVVRFQEMAKLAMAEIYANGRIPILTGGTGFYIQALLYDIDFSTQEGDPAYRRELEAYAEEFGNHALHEKLKAVDPLSYHTIHENNRKRTIRALEYYHLCQSPISEHNQTERRKESPYRFAYFVLTEERSRLYHRIEERVDAMLRLGLTDEVRRLQEMGYHRNMVSMQALGYKEILDYLNGECTYEHAVSAIKQETRHFAKRQLTWFRREKDTIWIDRSQYKENQVVLELIIHHLKEKGIIESC